MKKLILLVVGIGIILVSGNIVFGENSSSDDLEFEEVGKELGEAFEKIMNDMKAGDKEWWNFHKKNEMRDSGNTDGVDNDAIDNSVGKKVGEKLKEIDNNNFYNNDKLNDDEILSEQPKYSDNGGLDKVVKVTIGEKTISVDGKKYDMDVAPYIQDFSHSTMVPLRFVMIALGVDSDNVGLFDESNRVSFDSNDKTATIFYASGTNIIIIQFTDGSNIMIVNGKSISMGAVKAEIVDGRMFVPFRAIGTALDINVGWDNATRTATYNG